jgi:signal transduction histidine kinase/DNA-binding response OmpR family regulator
MAGPATAEERRMILVVEDSPTQAQKLCFFLEDNGFSCQIATNGLLALEQMEMIEPALIIVDVMMPEMNGFEFARRVKTNPRWARIPIILVTALMESSDVIRGLECGADNFINKPYQADFLLSRIKRLLVLRNMSNDEGQVESINMEIDGQAHVITAGRRQILDLLMSTYDQCMQTNRDLLAREEELQDSKSRFELLHNIAVTAGGAFDIDQIISTTLEEITSAGHVDVAAVFLTGEGGLRLKAHRDLPAPLVQEWANRNLSQSFLGEYSHEAESTTAPLGPPASDESLTSAEELSSFEEQNFIHVPIRAKGVTIGLLLAGPLGPPKRAKATSEMLLGVANQLAVSIENARLFESAQKARRHAEAVSHAKDEFLALVSHELRAPLNAILGWTNALLNKAVDDDMRRRALETIERSARAQSQLIEDLLDMGRIVSGKMRLEVRPVDLADVLDAALEVVQPAAEAKSITLTTSLETQADIITGDPDRLQQIVWNLLSNAIKFTPAGGRVDITLARADPHVKLTVADNGRGIDREFLPLVFERFRQADQSGGKRSAGLGLGLALVKQLVELHGGTITVASEGEGRGAAFSVLLPLRAVRTQSMRDSQEMLVLRGGAADKALLLADLTILVVDDETDARDLVTAVLEQYGADVMPVGSADEALSLLGKVKPEARPHVIVCDIAMPGEDGYSLMRKVRALTHAQGVHIPAVALTAFGRSSDRVRALAAGFQMHVPKPVEPAELALVVASLAGRALHS